MPYCAQPTPIVQMDTAAAITNVQMQLFVRVISIMGTTAHFLQSVLRSIVEAYLNNASINLNLKVC